MTATVVHDAFRVDLLRPACRTARSGLAAYARARLPQRAAVRLTAHLECCRGCAAAYVELLDSRG